MSSSVWKERLDNTDKRRVGDVRNDWERDLARVIHSSSFRRLQSKTQVLGLGESDFYRTRLTHSMEVSQIGVGIVKHLQEKHKNDEEICSALPDNSLMSAICLAHDIGHPPFGHGGEVALNFCMLDDGGFEGNGQTLRILSKLDKHSKTNGLNPTRRMLLGVLKYPSAYSQCVNEEFYQKNTTKTPSWLFKSASLKPPKCYHDSEKHIVDFILKPLDQGDREIFTFCDYKKDKQTGKKYNKEHKKPKHKALDTSIMELADDISYSLHDLEDAISLGMITRDMWDKHNIDKHHYYEITKQKPDTIAEELFSKEHYQRKQAIGTLVNIFISNIHVKTTAFLSSQNPLLKYKAKLPQEHSVLMEHIHELVKKYVIEHENVQQLEFKGQKLIVELFEVLASDPKRFLSSRTKERYIHENEDTRVICDFVAGMTDEYATRLYEKIFNPGKGSIFDRL